MAMREQRREEQVTNRGGEEQCAGDDEKHRGDAAFWHGEILAEDGEFAIWRLLPQ